MQLNLKQSQSGLWNQPPFGFSWTTLFFGGFVPLLRGDLKWFIIMWIVSAITFGISWFIFPFVYNGIFIKGLLEKGYVASDEESKNILKNLGYIQ